MTTRDTVRLAVQTRINDTGAAVFTTTELNSFLEQACNALFPTWYRLETGTTTAGAGPLQTGPSLSGGRLYYVGMQTTTSNRVRTLRGWQQGYTSHLVPKVGISGNTLVWAWYYPPPNQTSDGVAWGLFPPEEMAVIIKTQIACLEQVLQDRARKSLYLAANVREGVTEQEIAITLDALHATYEDLAKNAIPVPNRVG